jgi:hypothetical protein
MGTRLIAALMIGIGAIPALLGRLSPDSAWLLYAAGRVLDGAKLNVDVVEVNPPLIIWMDLVPVKLGRILHVPEVTTWVTLIVVLACVSAALTTYLVSRELAERPALRRAVWLTTLFILIPLARQDFGQREHLFLILALPYVAVMGLRANSRQVNPAVALLTGTAAGIGIALKPYFALFWLAIELSVHAGSPRGARWVRPENVAVVVVGLVYLAVVGWMAPEYFRIVQLMAAPYYDFLSNSHLATAFLGEGALLPVVAVLALLALSSTAHPTQLQSVLAWATAGLWIAAVLQHKGWRYHFYPAFALAFWLLALTYLNTPRPIQKLTARLYAALVFAALASTLAATLGAGAFQAVTPRSPRWDVDPDLHRLLPIVRSYAEGRSIAMLSWGIASTFPLANEARVEVASRFPSLWAIGGIYWTAIRSDGPIRYHRREEMGELERYVNDAVVSDLAGGKPRLIGVLRPEPDRREWGLRRLDLLGYFLRDPRFASLFRRYRFLTAIGEYWVFVRIPEDAPSVAGWTPPSHPAERPDPALSGSVQALHWSQVIVGLALLGLMGAGLLRESRS